MPAYFIQLRPRLNAEPDLSQVERDKSTQTNQLISERP